MAKTKPRYQEPPGDEIRDAIWAQGHIRPWQLLRIVAWKSAKGTASLCLNTEQQVVDQTRTAVTILRPYRDLDVITGVDWDKWEADVQSAIGVWKRSGLLMLEGVGYPVATAVLATLAPQAFPVLDRWAVEGVFGAEVAGSSKWRRAAVYRTYAEFLASNTHPDLQDLTTVHERDQRVMNSVMKGIPLPGLIPIALPGDEAAQMPL